MTKNTRAVVLTRLACIGCLALAGVVSCTPTPSANLSGDWSGTLTYTSGPMTALTSPFTLVLLDDEGDVTGSGTFSGGGANAFDVPVTLGAVHADTVVLEAAGNSPYTTPQTPVRFTFDGEVTATTMSGVGTHTVGSKAYNFTWQATLLAPPAES
jgi:hypothetical protein